MTSPLKGRAPNHGYPVSRLEAFLVLWGTLLWASEAGRASRLSPSEWESAVKFLTPQEIVVIALHVIRGMTHAKVGEWLGTSRGRSSQHLQSALAKLNSPQFLALAS